ncbi:13949_t:CDS:2 [Gigaspora rosea]|nr:13949_t:CDS:2 [Gigaspora rosea]
MSTAIAIIKQTISRNFLQRIIKEVPEELKDLTNVKEILIVQEFSVISVYNLCGGQYAYQEYIINFLQDLQEFVTRLPCDPSLLDIILAQCHFNEFTFYDFTQENSIEWPYIEGYPIDEFCTAGYMVKAFSTLFPRV